MAAGDLKPVIWVRSSYDDLMAFPQEARRHIGFALKAAQIGEKSGDAKALRGFGGANVLEIIEDFDGDTYRAVYTVRYAEAVYVLHCFQKKSRHGIATNKRDLDLVRERLKRAEELHQRRK